MPCDLPPHTHSQVFTGLLDVWHRAEHTGLRFFVVGARVPGEDPLRFVLPVARGEAGFARGRGLSGTALSGSKVAMARAPVASPEASVARHHMTPPKVSQVIVISDVINSHTDASTPCFFE